LRFGAGVLSIRCAFAPREVVMCAASRSLSLAAQHGAASGREVSGDDT
jgi:hypothetical protein